ncbi:hypothetical protein SLE2022_185050 [Rubroshorea leprosula]
MHHTQRRKLVLAVDESSIFFLGKQLRRMRVVWVHMCPVKSSVGKCRCFGNVVVGWLRAMHQYVPSWGHEIFGGHC